MMHKEEDILTGALFFLPFHTAYADVLSAPAAVRISASAS